jgi:hypothetical protein
VSSYFKVEIKPEYKFLPNEIKTDLLSIEDGLIDCTDIDGRAYEIPKYCIEKIVPVDNFCY